jgi:tRNA(adenine34) deaminase
MIDEPTMHEAFMKLALAEAQKARDYGEVPIGAVVVRDGKVIGRGHNWRETWRDPTAHAEMVAIQDASRRLGGWRLEGCDLYVTLEPCPMCAGAIMLARIRHLYYGVPDPKGGAIGSKITLLQPGLWNHHPEITGGILADECGMILKDFFRELRKSRQSTRRDV